MLSRLTKWTRRRLPPSLGGTAHQTKEFGGIWMTESGTFAYRVIPKCGCSTIGQIMYYSDHGKFYDGDIHDAEEGLHKWRLGESQAIITRNVESHKSYAFTCVRNPYRRILSCFFDKICGIQRNGNRYRHGRLTDLVHKYGVEVGGEDGSEDFDQVRSFKRFLLFARDTICWHRPMKPDIHWGTMWSMANTFITSGGRYDRIVHLENLKDDIAYVLVQRQTPYPVNLQTIPRFNESVGHGPKRAHPVADYFDDFSMHLVHEIYGRDFKLFKYDFENPSNEMPVGEIDLDEVYADLSR